MYKNSSLRKTFTHINLLALLSITVSSIRADNIPSVSELSQPITSTVANVPTSITDPKLGNVPSVSSLSVPVINWGDPLPNVTDQLAGNIVPSVPIPALPGLGSADRYLPSVPSSLPVPSPQLPGLGSADRYLPSVPSSGTNPLAGSSTTFSISPNYSIGNTTFTPTNNFPTGGSYSFGNGVTFTNPTSAGAFGNSAGTFNPISSSDAQLLQEAQRRRESGQYNNRTPFLPGSANQTRLEQLEGNQNSASGGGLWGSRTTFDNTYGDHSSGFGGFNLGGLSDMFGNLGGVGGDSALAAALNAAASAAVNGAFNGNFNLGNVVGAGVGAGVGTAVANAGITNSPIINSALASGAGTAAGNLTSGALNGNIDLGNIARNAGAAAAGGAAGSAFLGIANDAGMPPALANAIAAGVGVGTSEFVRGGDNVLGAAGQAALGTGVSTAVGGGLPGSLAGTVASRVVGNNGAQTTVSTPGGGSVTAGGG